MSGTNPAAIRDTGGVGTGRDTIAVEDSEVVAAADAVGRYARSRTADAELAADVTQETITRLLARRGDLAAPAVLPYAIVTARNLLMSQARAADRARRHAHLVAAPTGTDSDAVIDLESEEERRALRAALDGLGEADRRLLWGHEVEQRSTRDLGDALGTSSGAVAVRLATARAKLRVEYLLSYRKVTLPTRACRSVLVALSAGDTRRQRALGAGRHLLECGTCAQLSEPLTRRERALAGWWPLPLAIPAGRLVWRWARQHPVASTATATAVVVGGVAGAWAVATPTDPDPAPAVAAATPSTAPATVAPAEPEAAIEVDGRPLLPLPADADLAPWVGREVVVRSARVLSVDADEGFWIGEGADQRVWVQLLTPDESGPQVRPGATVSFTARMTANGDGFAAGVGVDAGEGAELLTRQGHHLAVGADGVRLGPP